MSNSGEKLMYSNIQNNILTNLATSYAEIYRDKSIKKTQVQTSVLSVKCGDWCEECIKTFIDVDAIDKNPRYSIDDKNKIIDYYRNKVCKGACVCDVSDVNMKNEVIFLTDNVVIDNIDIAEIKNRLDQYMDKQYENYDKPADSKYLKS